VTPAKQREDEGPWLSIGALSKATGIAVETLRTWENRYGFPAPERKPSGHRVYPVSAVSRLRRIAQALAQGHRAGQVVSASEEALGRLLETGVGARPGMAPAPAAIPASEELPALLRLVKGFDGERLVRVFLSDWARMGPVEFLESRIAPLVRAVGEAWERGELEIRHEHFVSERIGDLLRSLRLPLEERATGPLVVYATLPGEMHGLGLQMSALVLAAVGCRCLYLGTEVPPPQVVSLARDLSARAVAISISAASRSAAATAALRKLRDGLPRKVVLLVGGEGAPAGRPGIDTATSLRELDAWGRRLTTGLPVVAVHPEP
jgi:MerR family transcriptional regulator, light-induced transcriptional regulator